MLRKLSDRLTYANVMATFGVFIALGVPPTRSTRSAALTSSTVR